MLPAKGKMIFYLEMDSQVMELHLLWSRMFVKKKTQSILLTYKRLVGHCNVNKLIRY